MNLFAAALAIIGSMLGALGGLYFKKAAAAFTFDLLSQIKNMPLLVGLGLYAASTGSFLYAFSLEKLSLIYPLASLSYVWVAAISVVALKEKMTSMKWLGVALIFIGTTLVAAF